MQSRCVCNCSVQQLVLLTDHYIHASTSTHDSMTSKVAVVMQNVQIIMQVGQQGLTAVCNNPVGDCIAWKAVSGSSTLQPAIYTFRPVKSM